jgi:CubicO group peptidase (beta-lactamase class C family)
MVGFQDKLTLAAPAVPFQPNTHQENYMNRPHHSLFGQFLTAIVLLIMCTSAWAEKDWNGLDSFVERGMEMWHVPGMAVTVVSSDEVMYRKGFGQTATSGGEQINEHTLFANASTTKAMVAAGILMLADEGKLQLDDLIIKHIPELHFKDPLLTAELTIRDLLVHRTGLPSTDVWTFFQDMPLDEQINRLQAVAAAAPLRSRHIYQNTMYELAGLVIERISRQRWDHFLAERLWKPIGMLETYGSRDQMKDGQTHVLPYLYADNELSRAEWDFPAHLADAAGSVWTSIHDMGLWAQFLLRDAVTADGERLISESGIAEMFKPQSLIARADFYPTVELTQPDWTSYGLAWFQQDFQGRKIDFHTGSLSGLITIIGLDRSGDRAVVVMGNRDHAEMRHAVLWAVMDNSGPEEQRDWNQEIFDLYANQAEQGNESWAESSKQRLRKTRPSLSGDHYLGAYESPVIGEIVIEKRGRELFLKTKKIEMPMSHWHLDTFLVEYQAWGLREFAEFRIGPDGTIRSLEVLGESFQPVSTP